MPTLTTLLALAALAAPQSPGLVDILVRVGDPVPQQTSGWQVANIVRAFEGRNGGWIAAITAHIDNGPIFPPTSTRMLIGQRASSSGDAVELIHESTRLQGYLDSPSMAGDSIAYIANGASGQPAGVWVDGQVIARVGDPIANGLGATWFSLQQVELTTSGDALVLGLASDPVAGVRGVVWRRSSNEILLDLKDPVVGFTHPASHLLSGIVTSPDGSHWSAILVESQTSHTAILADGAILDLGGGFLAKRGEPVPQSITGLTGSATWAGFEGGPAVFNDRGDYAFPGAFTVGGGAGSQSAIVRNGKRFSEGVNDFYPIGINDRGALLVAKYAAPFALLLDGGVVLDEQLGIDADGDGQADPGYVVNVPFQNRITRPNERRETFLTTAVRIPGSTSRMAIVRGRPSRVDFSTCDGTPNSTGAPAQLVAVGSAELVDNEVSLRILGLPSGSFGYVLMSRLDGFVPQAGGSAGTLCLGGAIGRMTDQIFAAGDDGRADANLNLMSIPQPTGPVAATAGIRWFAQSWYRDSVSGSPTSNFSSASVLTFR